MVNEAPDEDVEENAASSSHEIERLQQLIPEQEKEIKRLKDHNQELETRIELRENEIQGLHGELSSLKTVNEQLEFNNSRLESANYLLRLDVSYYCRQRNALGITTGVLGLYEVAKFLNSQSGSTSG